MADEVAETSLGKAGLDVNGELIAVVIDIAEAILDAVDDLTAVVLSLECATENRCNRHKEVPSQIRPTGSTRARILKERR